MTTEPDQTAGLPEFVFDGASFEGLDGFFAAIAATLGATGWGKNPDAFNDILRGGFGTPEGGFILRWTHSDTSAQRLGWPETIRWLEKTLTTCHPANVARIQAKLQAARHGQGQTLYDTITAIITDHGQEDGSPKTTSTSSSAEQPANPRRPTPLDKEHGDTPPRSEPRPGARRASLKDG
jgi:hypothetical protein